MYITCFAAVKVTPAGRSASPAAGQGEGGAQTSHVVWERAALSAHQTVSVYHVVRGTVGAHLNTSTPAGSRRS